MATIRWQYTVQRAPTTRNQEVAGSSASSRQWNTTPALDVGVDYLDRPANDDGRLPVSRHMAADL